MIRFVNDYCENVYPEILEGLIKTNLEGNHGYSGDAHSAAARELIRRKIQGDTADV